MYIPRVVRLWKNKLFRPFDGHIKLRQRYEQKVGLSLKAAPELEETFTAKLFHRMIFLDRHASELGTRISDKYLVRDWAKARIGGKYLTELLWTGTNPKDIPFESLPKKCIAKTNHGSGWNVVITHPANRETIVDKLNRWLRENYYWVFREAQYFRIKPRILIESLVDDGHINGPLDYRFWCFNGRPELIQVDDNQHSLINPFYDPKWKRLQLSYKVGKRDFAVPRPKKLDEMLRVAAMLAHGFDYVRVDLYNVSGQVYFGEMTLTPTAGTLAFEPPYWDAILGREWNVDTSILTD